MNSALAAVAGILGNVLADNVDGERYPRLFQFGRLCQAFGIAVPKMVQRFLGLVQGTKPTETPKPPSADGKTLAAGFALLAGGLLTQAACGHGGAACKVVDVAAESCKVVRYLAPDGSVEELTSDDLADLARAKKQARERAKAAEP